MNGKEMFAMLYDDKVGEDECIKVIHPEEKDHYLLRDRMYGDFDEYELYGCLMFPEYKFEVKKQKQVEAYLEKRDRKQKIERLKKELEALERDNTN